MIIERTVDIPADRRIFLDLPEVSSASKITVIFEADDTSAQILPFDAAFPAIEELKQQAADKTARRKADGRKPFEGLCGVLEHSRALTGDPVEIVRAWRDEWKTPR